MTRRDFLSALPVLGLSQAQEPSQTIYTAPVQFLRETTYDPKGDMHFYAMVCPDGRCSLVADGDLEIVQALRQCEGQRVRVVIEPYQVEKLER